MTNHAAQLAIIKHVTRQESRSSAGSDHVADQVQLIRLILASGSTRHLLAHLPDTRQLNPATPACSSCYFGPGFIFLSLSSSQTFHPIFQGNMLIKYAKIYPKEDSSPHCCCPHQDHLCSRYPRLWPEVPYELLSWTSYSCPCSPALYWAQQPG